MELDLDNNREANDVESRILREAGMLVLDSGLQIHVSLLLSSFPACFLFSKVKPLPEHSQR